MEKDANNEVDRIVADFIGRNPSATVADWKRLIEANPRYAAKLADASALHLGDSTADDEEETPSGVQIDEALFSKTLSGAINMLHCVPPAMVEAAEKKVAEVKGPAVRKLATDIGLGPYASLLSGVLVGRVAAPRRILKGLERALGVPMAAMQEVFRRSQLESAVPAWKSHVTPEVSTRQSSWEEAVSELSLSEEERARLLAFAKEG